MRRLDNIVLVRVYDYTVLGRVVGESVRCSRTCARSLVSLTASAASVGGGGRGRMGMEVGDCEGEHDSFIVSVQERRTLPVTQATLNVL